MFSAIIRLSKFSPDFWPLLPNLNLGFKIPRLKHLVQGFIFAQDIMYTFSNHAASKTVL